MVSRRPQRVTGRRWLAGSAAGVLSVVILIGGCASPGTGEGDGGVGAPSFTDVAAAVGIDFEHGAFRWSVTPDPVPMMGGGLCWLDYDGDGWLDLFAVNGYARQEATRWTDEGGLPRSALFRNLGGRFEDVSVRAGVGLPIRGQGCVAADFDLDGHTDLYVTADGPSSLLWNEGDGSFRDGTAEAGVEAFGWHTGAAVGDVDGNGWPDLFVSGYADLANRITGTERGFPGTFRGVRDLLYLNQGSAPGERPRFLEVGVAAGLEVVELEYALGASLTDVDLDGDLDLYVANDTEPNRLYVNVPWPGGAAADPAGLGFRFEEVSGRAGVADPNAGMGVAIGDLDGDGLEDLFVTNSRGQGHAVYRRLAEAAPAFEDVRGGIGVDVAGTTGWGVTWADVDNDTDEDLIMVSGEIPVTDLAADAQDPRLLMSRTAEGEPGRFVEAGPRMGFEDLGPLLARGSAVADYDNDGDLDVAINVIGGRLVLLENSGPTGRWLIVRPTGFAPGARVTVTLEDGTRLIREIRAGSSYLSSEDPRAHFGIGSTGRVAEVRVRWPSGTETVRTEVEAGQILDLAVGR